MSIASTVGIATVLMSQKASSPDCFDCAVAISARQYHQSNARILSFSAQFFHIRREITTATRVADEEASRGFERRPRRDGCRGSSAGAGGGGRRQRKPERG